MSLKCAHTACAPHAGAFKHWRVAMAKLDANEAEGWSPGAAGPLPFWPLRSAPYSVVDETARRGKPKHRLTTDLSWPHLGALDDECGPVDSVNGAMARDVWPRNPLVRVAEFGDAIAILRGSARHRAVD